MRWADADWLLPLAGLSATLFATDSSFHQSQSNVPAAIQRYKTISTAGVGALAGAAGGMWLLSYGSHGRLDNEHWRETGFLAGEAALNSLAMAETLKYSLRRQRPLEGNGSGPFFQSGGTSFPSEHAAAAWSIAGVVAHEYPGPLTKIAAYGLAAVVSFSRVRASQHFPSDVLIGSLAGYMISQNIYSRRTRTERHAEEPSGEEPHGADWPSFSEMFRTGEDTPAESMGSPYVPLDGWVYPAIERLQALGYIHSAFEGTKPWARTECARLIAEAIEVANSEANDELAQGSPGHSAAADEQAQALLAALAKEFHREAELQTGDRNLSAALPSAYTRVVSASGAVLTDGYHFGQTYAYDYGRPFRRGTNFISGFSTDFTSGRVFLHLSGEVQHAPYAPHLSDAVREVIAERDLVPISPAQPFDAINRVAMMDSYLGFNVDGWQFSFGKQSLSWGPGPGGSLILSGNIDPFYMVRLTQAQPIELPSFLRLLGPVHLETFMGREKGHPISGRPFLYGQKISVKPFRSFEFSYARTTTIGGICDSLNTRTFFESYFGRVNAKEGSVPGDSHTSVDWTWHVPHGHDRFVFYGELESDDDPIPLQGMTRAVVRPGIYLVRLPFLNKWDFHAEWTSSESPGRAPADAHGLLNYWNSSYRDGYTNNGNLVGNTVGREGKTIQAWTRYWISPRQTLEFTAKNSEVDTDFIPGGGRWQDYRATHEMALGSGIFFRSFLQFERIGHFPLLFQGARNNVTASLEIGFSPGRVAH
jgi:membrane-associated phospholipid phosphatase